MRHLQKLGGMGALYEAAAYIIGIVGFLLVIGWPDDPAEQLAVLIDKQLAMHVLYLITYQIFALVLVVLALGLRERLKDYAPAMMQVATAVALIWATAVIASGMIFNVGMDRAVSLYAADQAAAESLWLAVSVVCDGLGGGNEILGGVWLLLVSAAAWRAHGQPIALSILGFVIGGAGAVSALPALSDVGVVFGLGQIVWFVWIGIVLLRSGDRTAAAGQS